MSSQPAQSRYDVVVVGGAAAGLSAALVLARSCRSVLVVDAGEPRNAAAAAVHGYLSRDGMSPTELLATGRAEVRRYGGELVDGRVDAAVRHDDGFLVTLESGAQVRGRRLLVTTGLVDELPAVPGLAERWGREVVHCPYCHGWELRTARIAVLASGPDPVHPALLFRQWSPHVQYLQHTADQPSASEREQLAARDVAVVTGVVVGLEVAQDRLAGVRLAGGELVPCDALVVAPQFVARTGLLTDLGLTPHCEPGGSCAVGDENGATAIRGVWVAGNVAELASQVVDAVATGSRAAIAINSDLVDEDVERAVQARARHHVQV